MAVNDDILDAEVSHAIGLQRLSSGILRRMLVILASTEADIEEKIRQRLEGLSDSQRDSDSTLARLNVLVFDIRAIAQEVNAASQAFLTKEMVELAGYEAHFQERLLSDVLPVRYEFNKPTAELLEAVVTKRPFQGRVLREWAESVGSATVTRVSDAVKIGVLQGESVDQVVKRVRGTRSLDFKDGVLEITRRDAEAVVRTAVTHVATGAAEVFYKANTDAIKGVRWTSVLDGRTTAICQARDGKVFKPGEGPRPPAHFRCRSTVTPVLRSFRELGIDLDDLPGVDRQSMNGKEPAGTTYNDWLRRQSAEFQDEVLGKIKGALFRRGDLSVDKFVDRSGHEYTIDELRKREAKAFERAGL